MGYLNPTPTCPNPAHQQINPILILTHQKQENLPNKSILDRLTV